MTTILKTLVIKRIRSFAGAQDDMRFWGIIGEWKRRVLKRKLFMVLTKCKTRRFHSPLPKKSARHSERSEESYKVFYKADSIAMEVVIIPDVQKNVWKLGMTWLCLLYNGEAEAIRCANRLCFPIMSHKTLLFRALARNLIIYCFKFINDNRYSY